MTLKAILDIVTNELKNLKNEVEQQTIESDVPSDIDGPDKASDKSGLILSPEGKHFKGGLIVDEDQMKLVSQKDIEKNENKVGQAVEQ